MMKTYSYQPQGVCSKQIDFSIDEAGKLHDVQFTGGCPGNLAAISAINLVAVVLRRIMTGRDHDAGRGTEFTGSERDGI